MKDVQLELPFLTPARAATVHAAAQAIERSVGAAVTARRYHEAEELQRVGNELMRMLDENAAAVRADHPAHQSALTASRRLSGLAGQAHSTDIEHPERSQ